MPTPARAAMWLGVLAWSPLASGWRSGAVRAGRPVTTSRSVFMPERFDMTIPANRARLDAVERPAVVADGAGLTLIQLALGFVTAHPAVTCAIIGPRTPGHLHAQLAAADTVLAADVLDAIVPPGVDPAARRSTTPRPTSSRRCAAAPSWSTRSGASWPSGRPVSRSRRRAAPRRGPP